MKPSYIEHIVSASFGGAVRYALSVRWIGISPLAGVELPRDQGDVENDLPELSYVEVETLADEAGEVTGRQMDRVLTHLLAYVGPRIGEATALKVRDVDAIGKRVRVHRTWTVDENGKRIIGPVKNWQKRWLPLSDFLAREIEALIADRDPDDFVFASKRGVAVDGRNWYNRVWVAVRRNTGLADGFSVHDLRHVAASLAIAAGADVKLVQQMLGHKDATETLNTYAHLWPDKVAEVTTKVEARRNEALQSARGEGGFEAA